MSAPASARTDAARGRDAGRLPVVRGPAGTPLRALLLRPFVLPFVLLLGVGLAVLLGVNRNALSGRLVSDSQTRMILLSSLSADISAMETGERGFVISGQPSFLTPYTDGRRNFLAHAYALDDLSVTAEQKAGLARVRALVDRWLRGSAEPEIRARQVSLQAAVSLVSTGSGQGILDTARSALQELRDRETTLLSEATTSSQETLNRVRLITLMGLGLGMLLLIVTAWQVARTLSGSLDLLGRHAREIAAGQYHLRLPATPVRELALLGAQFDLMTAAVQERERALQVSNERLERSNRELEQFAYVASHDLQEPLRTISSYTELLARRYAGQLDERADRYIAFTTTATGRLKTLIQDLLAYSRVRQEQRPLAPVDTRGLVQEVLHDLAGQLQDCGGRVELAELPAVTANAELLRHAFQNLIANALKFRAPGRAPVVRVGAERQDGRWVFGVQDNGIGIEPQYHERIFGVFQRLHGIDEYPGSGIGLAVTHSAVQQHGGELWLHSVPDEGTTFYFSLPDEPPAGQGAEA